MIGLLLSQIGGQGLDTGESVLNMVLFSISFPDASTPITIPTFFASLSFPK
jgi:hypothetical protein